MYEFKGKCLCPSLCLPSSLFLFSAICHFRFFFLVHLLVVLHHWVQNMVTDDGVGSSVSGENGGVVVKMHQTVGSVKQYFLHSIRLYGTEKKYRPANICIKKKMYFTEKPKMSTFLVHTDFESGSNSFYRGVKSLRKKTKNDSISSSCFVTCGCEQPTALATITNVHIRIFLVEHFLLMIHAAVCARLNLLNTLGYRTHSYFRFPIDIRTAIFSSSHFPYLFACGSLSWCRCQEK